jgi:hypothetical protein
MRNVTSSGSRRIRLTTVRTLGRRGPLPETPKAAAG